MKLAHLFILPILAFSLGGCSYFMVELTAEVLGPLGFDLLGSLAQKPQNALVCKDGKPDLSQTYIADYDEFGLNIARNFVTKSKENKTLAKEKFNANSKYVSYSDDPKYGEYIVSAARFSPFRSDESRYGLYTKEINFMLKNISYKDGNLWYEFLVNGKLYYKDGIEAGVKSDIENAYKRCFDKYLYEFMKLGSKSVTLLAKDIESDKIYIDFKLDAKICDEYLEQVNYCK